MITTSAVCSIVPPFCPVALLESRPIRAGPAISSRDRGILPHDRSVAAIGVPKQARTLRLELSYTRQHLFRKELKRAQSALRLLRARTLKGEVNHSSSYFIAALLDLLHNRIRTADKICWQGAIPKGWPWHPCDVAGIKLGEGITHGRPHGERHLRLLLPSLQRLLGFRVTVGQENVAAIDNVLPCGLPAVLCALRPIVARRLAHGLEWSKGYTETEVIARRELTGLAARAQRVGRWIRLLQRARPDRDVAVLEMTALPDERIGLRPGFQDQLHAFCGFGPCLFGFDIIDQILIRRPPQEPHHKATLRQVIEHGELLGYAHWIVQRDDRAEHGDLHIVQVRCYVRCHHDGRWGENPSTVVVLGKAHPVEAEFVNKLQPFDRTLEGLYTHLRIVKPRRHGPLRRHFLGRDVSYGFKKRCLHGLPSSAPILLWLMRRSLAACCIPRCALRLHMPIGTWPRGP